MMPTLKFLLLGYLSGSILYARVFSALLGRGDITARSPDRNPGTANAFQYGGFLCGAMTLLCDIGKGFLPVHLLTLSAWQGETFPLLTALAIAAPVLGHAFPLFYGFRGGKAIAVTFGCLIGLLPVHAPLFALVCFFLFFSLIVRVSPNLYRTAAAYLCAAAVLPFSGCGAAERIGFLLMAGTVCLRLCLSHEEKEKVRVQLLWMH